MLARLSASDYPALSALTTRDDDDFTIAFLDATSMVLDILTFYQRAARQQQATCVPTMQHSVAHRVVAVDRLSAHRPA